MCPPRLEMEPVDVSGGEPIWVVKGGVPQGWEVAQSVKSLLHKPGGYSLDPQNPSNKNQEWQCVSVILAWEKTGKFLGSLTS